MATWTWPSGSAFSHGCLPPSVSDVGTRAVVVSLSANLAGDASLAVLTENLRLLDDTMCSGR